MSLVMDVVYIFDVGSAGYGLVGEALCRTQRKPKRRQRSLLSDGAPA